MYNNNIHTELQEAQQKKIDYFCEFIDDNNIPQAEHYLNKANWDENLAIQIYFNRRDSNKQNYHNINNIHKDNNLKRNANLKKINQINNIIDEKTDVKSMYNEENKYIEFNVDNLIVNKEKNKDTHYSHDKILLYIKNTLKNVEINFKSFMKKLVNNAGIILIFKEENHVKIKEQINQINELKEKVKNYIIFPVPSNSNEGIEIILGLCCVSFPSYIFCKYKSDNTIFITDKMEGAFEKSFLLECLYKIIQPLDPVSNAKNDNSNKILPTKLQTNPKIKENNDILTNILNEFKYVEPIKIKKKIYTDKNKNEKGKNIQIQHKNFNKKDNINDIENNEKNEKNVYNKNNMVENNNNQNKSNYKNNTNIFINNKNSEINNNIDINSKNDMNRKNEINYSNYGDFFLGDSIEIPNLFGLNNNNINSDYKFEKQENNDFNKDNENISNNKDNIQNILNNSNNILNNSKENVMRLSDSIYNLSDGQILAKREQEMRKLEKIQEEKEKEEKRKQEEENKKIKKYEKESEIAKMVLAPEPDDNNPDTCHIRFRLPDGEKFLERKFLKSDKISVLYNYIKSIGRDIFMEPDANDFNIISLGFPQKNLENVKNSTLEKEGLYPNSLLQIQEK